MPEQRPAAAPGVTAARAGAQATAESLESQVAGLRAELGTELLGSLSPEERRELPTLNPELERLQVGR